MKYIQKVKVKSDNGKISKEPVSEIKAVVESIADNLVIDGENSIKKLPKTGVEILTVWEEKTEKEKVKQDIDSGKVEAPKKATAKKEEK